MEIGKYSISAWLAILVSFLVLVLSIYNILVAGTIKSMQVERKDSLESLQKGVRLHQINKQLIKALANISAQSGDQDIQNMLASEGVTFTVNAK